VNVPLVTKTRFVTAAGGSCPASAFIAASA
jgi:hypothetical protein